MSAARAWQKAYAEKRALPVSGPEHEAHRASHRVVVTRGVRGGPHGWDTETVPCRTREDADALVDAALALPWTSDVRIDDWTSGRPVKVRSERPVRKGRA